MSNARPIYLLARDGAGPGLDDLIPGRRPIRVSEAVELRSLPPGLLLLPLETVGSDEVLAALRIAAEGPSEGGWLAVLVDGPSGGRPPRMLPVSIGWPVREAEVERWVEGAEDARVLELRLVLTQIGRARHDLNNPLTSAMAETQLALLDVQDPTLRQGLETIEEQLRRIRDLVAALRTLRPPV